MVRRSAFLILVGVALALVSCGQASDGAALVHGTLFAGRAPWQRSLELTGRAVVHGALPFRIQIEPVPQDAQGAGRGGLTAGLTLEIRSNHMPSSGVSLDVGKLEGPQATIRWVPQGGPSPTSESDGSDLRYSDGGFEVHAVDGTLEVDLDGRAPGSAVRGQFELRFQTGETVRGTFASVLVD